MGDIAVGGGPLILAFTGHRPEKLPWGSDEADPRCLALKRQIADAVAQAAAEGVDIFLCGMARGCDFYFAEAVLAQGLWLEAYLPCSSQADGWPQPDRDRYQRLLIECGAVYLLEREYTEGCMLRRNRAMIARADRVLSVWDGSPGGTQAAVRYARQRGVPVSGLWL